MKRSTKAFIAEGRESEGYSLYDLLHGYVYTRWPYLYIGIGVGEHPLARAYQRLRTGLAHLLGSTREPNPNISSVAEVYHGKVLIPASAHALLQVQEDIELRDLEHVIPYPTARDIILKNPNHLVALECPCRAARGDPCLPLAVCLIVGDPFADFVLEHHPDRTKALTREQAIQLLKDERSRGHVHHAFFKDAMLGRFYAICNCCSCCCGAIQRTRKGDPMIMSSGYLVHVDQERCRGCATCHGACNFGALYKRGEKTAVLDEHCMGCGLCIEVCEQGALTLALEPSKGAPLDIIKLIEEACGNPPELNEEIHPGVNRENQATVL